MRDFAEMLERLHRTTEPVARCGLLGAYFATVPDPDRGFGLALLAGGLRLPRVRPALLRALIAARSDPVLLALSLDFVGDLAETVALLWPDPPGGPASPLRLGAVVTALAATPQAELPALLAAWLDTADPDLRSALLLLVTGGARAEVSPGEARAALAAWGGLDPAAVEAVWHGLDPPYAGLFAWAEGRAPRPEPAGVPLFHPPMLGQPITMAEAAALDPAAFCAEWKWDGLRVQLVAGPTGRRVFSRAGDDISAVVPEIVAAMDFHAVLDGELLALAVPSAPVGAGEPPAAGMGLPGPFASLRRRLDRQAPGVALRRAVPVGVRLFDILFAGTEDLRNLPFVTRRARLEEWFAATAPRRMDLSPLLAFTDMAELAGRHGEGRAAGSTGLMLKRRDSPYRAGRPRGAWWKCTPAPRQIDAVLMYAHAGDGAGRGSGYTLGVWDGATLVAVGKVEAGATEVDPAWLDRWIRTHMIARFGPVREVEKTLVLAVAFESAVASPRRKSALVLRGPRILRLRTDKDAAAADRIETLRALAGR